MEQPRIAGVGGGVGVTTLAAAMQATDCGIYRGGDLVDVLVCRSTMYSLGCAQRAINATPSPPVLAVVADVPGGSMTSTAKTRLRMTEPRVAGVVVVPFVPDWRGVDTPWQEAAGVLFRDPPKALRAFADALQNLVDELTARAVRPAPRVPDLVAPAWPSAR